jgi:hypothetical protein
LHEEARLKTGPYVWSKPLHIGRVEMMGRAWERS